MALPVVVIIDMLTGYLSIYFGFILATTHDNCYGQLSHKTEEDRSLTYFEFYQI